MYTLLIKFSPGSIAEELEIEEETALVFRSTDRRSGMFLTIIILVNDDFLTVLIEKSTGEQWELEIEKDYEDDLGIEFESGTDG